MLINTEQATRRDSAAGTWRPGVKRDSADEPALTLRRRSMKVSVLGLGQMGKWASNTKGALAVQRRFRRGWRRRRRGRLGFPGGDTLVCKWSRPVKQDIVRYAYFLQQYRCVDDDPKKYGSTPSLFPDNVTIESHIEKKNKPGSYETSVQDFFSPGFQGIPIGDEIINKLLCNKYKGILPK